MNYDRMIVVEVKIELKETCAQGVSNTIIIQLHPLLRYTETLSHYTSPRSPKHVST